MISLLAFVVVFMAIILIYRWWENRGYGKNTALTKRLDVIRNSINSVNAYSFGLKHSPPKVGSLTTWLRTQSWVFVYLDNLVKRSDLPLTIERLLVIVFTVFVFVVLFGILYEINVLLLCMLVLVSFGIPMFWIIRKAALHQKAFYTQFPDVLDYLSRALRVGQSISSALKNASTEFEAPVSLELKVLSDEIEFGVPFKDALTHMSDRLQIKDIDFFVIALILQHEGGGNLVEIMDGLAATIRERSRVHMEIKTLSAEGELSFWILSFLPVIFAGIFAIINPSHIGVLWTTPEGEQLLMLSVVLLLLGIVTLRSIANIKV